MVISSVPVHYSLRTMQLALWDWVVVGAYATFAVVVGIRYAKRAGQDVDQFFLSGRQLPWWIAGTSMVATTFAADTPLVIAGWVRDHGIWMNWSWWCLAVGGMLSVFLFAPYWRRGEVMTSAELAELRYGGRGARGLRAFLGLYHAGITNAIVLCWVLLAAAKILDVLLGVDRTTALLAASAIALSYSLLAGFWGVVVTDVVQFVMAMVGAVALAFIAWGAVGGTEALSAAVASGAIPAERLTFFPAPGASSWLDAGFWTVPLVSVAVYLGVSWWAVDSVDGGGLVVQRLAATRDERHSVLAALWYNVAHYALRPWPWIAVGLASLLVLPQLEVLAPSEGVVTAVTAEVVELRVPGREAITRVELPGESDWQARAVVAVGDTVVRGELLARTDSELAYPTMMARYLPVGLLGLVVASLLAAFMSTIDTHVNLAASYFVNDLYRRFVRKDASPRHYVAAARWASAGVLALAGLAASRASSISDLFFFFLAFLSGVGPIYILRWLWWRVRAGTEITAMVSSSLAAITLTLLDVEWSLGPFSQDGELLHIGRLCLVVSFSLVCSLTSVLLQRRPDPASLVAFYRKVRPLGWWGPVRALAPDVERPTEGRAVLLGILGGLTATYGTMIGIGALLLGRPGAGTAALVPAALGAAAVVIALRRLLRTAR